jgi:hypothetical protein
MYTREILIESVYENIITIIEYDILVNKELPIDMSIYNPNIYLKKELNKYDTLRFYILLIKTDVYKYWESYETLLNLMESSNVYDVGYEYETITSQDSKEGCKTSYRTYETIMYGLREFARVFIG